MRRVLLVEDSKIIKILHERVLTRAGYQVVSAADGEEALRVASVAAPDLILLDMLLPRISGPQVLRSLKENPVTNHIPIIVLTSLSRKNEEKLLRDGADAFLEKGDLLDSAEPLLALISRTLQESRPAKPSFAPAEPEMSWILNQTEAAPPART